MIKFIRHKHGYLKYITQKYDEEKYFFLLDVKVKPKFRNKGIATSLLKTFFEKAFQQKRVIYPGILLPSGKKYLKPVMIRFSKQFEVEIRW